MKLNIYGKKRLNIENYLRTILFLLTLYSTLKTFLIKTMLKIKYLKKFNLIIYDLLYKSRFSLIISLYFTVSITLDD